MTVKSAVSSNHPRCFCGSAATMIVDVIFDGQVVERAPVCGQDCARGIGREWKNRRVDTVVDADSLGAVLAVAPCWCKMRETAYCDWCPRHGERELISPA